MFFAERAGPSCGACGGGDCGCERRSQSVGHETMHLQPPSPAVGGAVGSSSRRLIIKAASSHARARGRVRFE